MTITIQTRGFNLSQALRDYVESKLRLTLGRYNEKIDKVDVTLFDVNGPRGGEDMCCKLIVKPFGMASIVIEETAADMYDAVNTCCHRAKRTVNRHLTRIERKGRKVSLGMHVDRFISNDGLEAVVSAKRVLAANRY